MTMVYARSMSKYCRGRVMISFAMGRIRGSEACIPARSDTEFTVTVW